MEDEDIILPSCWYSTEAPLAHHNVASVVTGQQGEYDDLFMGNELMVIGDSNDVVPGFLELIPQPASMSPEDSAEDEIQQEEIEDSYRPSVVAEGGPRFQPLNLFGFPYFKGLDGSKPPISHEWDQLGGAVNVNHLITPLTKWEEKELTTQVHNEAKRIFTKSLWQTSFELGEEIRNRFGEPPVFASQEEGEEYLRLNQYYTEVNAAIDDQRKVPDEKINELSHLFNWRGIAEKFPYREVEELKSYYDHKIRTDVTRGKWHKDDNQVLKRLVAAYGTDSVNWDRLTAELNQIRGTNRTVYECFSRFRSRFSRDRVKLWTEEENQKLAGLISQMEVEHRDWLNWRLVLPHFVGRTNSQIYSHFHYQSNKGESNIGGFDKFDAQCVALAVDQGLSVNDVEAIFDFQRTATQIRTKMKHFRHSPTDLKAMIKRAPKVAHILIDLVIQRRHMLDETHPDRRAVKEIEDLIYSKTKEFQIRNKTGRPVKKVITEEDAFRQLVRPFMIINKKRPRQSSMPGDARVHGLILASVYRSLSGCFRPDLVEANDKDLEKMGVEMPYCLPLWTALEMIKEFPPRADKWSTQTLQGRLAVCLPPTIVTLTGLRGLCLYQRGLQQQVDGTYGQTVSERQAKEEAENKSDDEDDGFDSDEPVGDSMADALLLRRMIQLFYWSHQLSKMKTLAEPAIEEIREEVVTPPPAKKARTVAPKKIKVPKVSAPAKPAAVVNNCRRGTRMRTKK